MLSTTIKRYLKCNSKPSSLNKGVFILILRFKNLWWIKNILKTMLTTVKLIFTIITMTSIFNLKIQRRLIFLNNQLKFPANKVIINNNKFSNSLLTGKIKQLLLVIVPRKLLVLVIQDLGFNKHLIYISQ